MNEINKNVYLLRALLQSKSLMKKKPHLYKTLNNTYIKTLKSYVLSIKEKKKLQLRKYYFVCKIQIMLCIYSIQIYFGRKKKTIAKWHRGTLPKEAREQINHQHFFCINK